MRLASLVLMAVLCVQNPCVQILAAADTRILSGTVTNNGEPIKGAVVEIENSSTLEIRSFITQQDGQYHFANLQFDVDYQVWATRGEKRSRKKTVSRFSGKKSDKIDLVLE